MSLVQFLIGRFINVIKLFIPIFIGSSLHSFNSFQRGKDYDYVLGSNLLIYFINRELSLYEEPKVPLVSSVPFSPMFINRIYFWLVTITFSIINKKINKNFFSPAFTRYSSDLQ